MKAQRNLNTKISIPKQIQTQLRKRRNDRWILLFLFFIPNLSQAQNSASQELIAPLPSFEFSNLLDFWSLRFENSRAGGDVNFSLLSTFRQTEAFRPFLKSNKSLTYHQPSKSPNRFNTTPTTGFSSFLMQQQTPGYLEFNELGWFCTLDLKLDMRMKVPLRFRLGNLETVNRKEGYYD